MEDTRERQKKQQYLRIQILQKNYDPQQFVKFLNTRLSIGDNLDLCSFDQLKIVVKQFVELEKQQQANNIKNQEQKETETIQNALEGVNISKIAYKPRQVLFTKVNPNFMELQYDKSYKCIKINNKYSQHKDIKCQVSNPQRKNVGGIFGIGATSFLEFKVTTYGLNWSVGRRYSDFVWLRLHLLKVFPTHIIPPIPDKKASKKTQRHVQKRMRILQYFLNDLINIPQFLNNKFVQGFLSYTDNNKFQNLKKQSQKIKPFEAITSLQNQQGIVKIKLSQQNKVFMQQIQKFVPKAQKAYKQITRSSKQLQNLFTQQVNTLYQIGNHFAQLHQDVRGILNKLPLTTGLGKINQIYITLNNMMIQWGNILRNQHGIIQKNFNTFFKYVRNQLYGFNQVLIKQQQIQIQYAKMKIALDKKKQKIYSFHDPSKWQINSKQIPNISKQVIFDKNQAFSIMLPRQTIDLQALKTKLFFYINQYHINGSKNLDRVATKFCDNFKQFAIKVKVNNQQLGQMWMEMASNFSNPNKKATSLKQIPKIQDRSNQIVDD